MVKTGGFCKARAARCSWFLVLGSWFLVLGSWLALRARLQLVAFIEGMLGVLACLRKYKVNKDITPRR